MVVNAWGVKEMKWKIERILHYEEEKRWGSGFAHYGFHDSRGNRYLFNYAKNWIGCLDEEDGFRWTAGVEVDVETACFMEADFAKPIFLTDAQDGTLLVSCHENAKIFRLNPEQKTVVELVDGKSLGMKDISSSNLAGDGNLWVSEITGCKVWCLDRKGRVVETLGDGEPGFKLEPTSFEKVRFNWIYVMQRGPDGNPYVMDSTNYAVRRLNLESRIVENVVGTGKPGYSGDGGEAVKAALGGDPEEHFNGPYGMCVDEAGNIYIADTFNHVVRFVDSSTGMISTIAGRHTMESEKINDLREIDPMNLNLPKICGLDYFNGRLFIPEWDGDLVILKKS